MRPHPRRTITDPTNPRAWGTSDRNGHIGQHARMRFQFDWAGTQLINRRILVHEDELDQPQRQLGTIILPPDPLPIMNARPENYAIDDRPVSTRVTMDGKIRIIEGSGAPLQTSRILNAAGDLP